MSTHNYSRGELQFGVQLKHLCTLPIQEEADFSQVCDYVRSVIAQSQATLDYRSYASYLLSGEDTKHLVKSQADVFVSYAWSGGFGRTMQALVDHFADQLETVFVWMDFAILDQHEVAVTQIDFNEWAAVFRENLLKTRRAVLVLTPGDEPIAMTRSWCCFEWLTICQTKIPFDFCVPKRDEKEMIEKILSGAIRAEVFARILSKINVANARAFKPGDQAAILDKMREVGLPRVNNIVMSSVKTWLSGILDRAVQAADKTGGYEPGEIAQRKLMLRYFRGSYKLILGDANDSLEDLEIAYILAQETNNQTMMARSLNQVGLVEFQKGDAHAEHRFDLALSIAKKASGGKNSRDVAFIHTNFGALLFDLRRLNEAQAHFKKALQIDKALNAKGGEVVENDGLYFPIARTLHNLAGVYSEMGKQSRAIKSYRRALEMVKSEPEHPQAALYMASLALALVKKKRINKKEIEEAERLVSDAFDITVRIHGKHHPDALKFSQIWSLVAARKATLGNWVIKSNRHPISAADGTGKQAGVLPKMMSRVRMLVWKGLMTIPMSATNGVLNLTLGALPSKTSRDKQMDDLEIGLQVQAGWEYRLLTDVRYVGRLTEGREVRLPMMAYGAGFMD